MDYATLANTGDSLILGHVNRASSTTRLVNVGDGPALRLKSTDEGSPALAVTNDSKVRRLNADELDGRTARQLASHAITFRAGKRGAVVTGGVGVWDAAVPAGNYQVSFQAVLFPSTGTALEPVPVVCGVVDALTLGPRTRIYTADSTTYVGSLPAAMSGAETVRIRPGQQPALVCSTAGNTPGTDFTLFRPVTASFVKINSRDVREAAVIAPGGSGRAFLGLRTH
jgi:hypothetical protein